MKESNGKCPDDENRLDGVEMLNVLSHEYNRWQTTSSPRDRIDVFGAQIPAGEPHYKLGLGTGDNVERLSLNSMQTFTNLLFSRNPELAKLAVDRHREEWRRLLDALNGRHGKSKPDQE